MVKRFLRKGALEAQLPMERIPEMDLLVEELVLNVCMHAYPEGEPGVLAITYSSPRPGALSVEVADQGIEFNPLSASPPDTTLSLEARPIGGVGILLLKTFAKSLAYRRERGWNRLTFDFAPDA
jgi:serine/threonine-protein kinase RsbW